MREKPRCLTNFALAHVINQLHRIAPPLPQGWAEMDKMREKLEDLKELRDLVRSLGRCAPLFLPGCDAQCDLHGAAQVAALLARRLRGYNACMEARSPPEPCIACPA